jgi:hypothetical protein
MAHSCRRTAVFSRRTCGEPSVAEDQQYDLAFGKSFDDGFTVFDTACLAVNPDFPTKAKALGERSLGPAQTGTGRLTGIPSPTQFLDAS